MFIKSIKPIFTAAIIILALVIGIVGILQLISSNIHDESEELRNFITSAQLFHDKLDKTSLLEDIPALLEITIQGTTGNPSGVELMIRSGALSAKGYKEQYYWLQPTTESLDLYDSLIREGQLIGNCYSTLNLIWTARQSGDYSNMEEQQKEVETLYDEVLSFRNKNSEELKNLLLQFNQETNH